MTRLCALPSRGKYRGADHGTDHGTDPDHERRYGGAPTGRIRPLWLVSV